jgi:hypothetical protein
MTIFGGLDEDVDLSFVTDLLGVQPTTLWRQCRRQAGRASPAHPARAQTFRLDLEYRRGNRLRQRGRSSRVLDTFEARTETIRRLCERLRLKVGIDLIVSLYGDIVGESDGSPEVNVSTRPFTSPSAR